jgi:hypothetical protein
VPVQTGPEAHSATCATGTGSFLGVAWPDRTADHSLPSTAGLRMGGDVPPPPLPLPISFYNKASRIDLGKGGQLHAPASFSQARLVPWLCNGSREFGRRPAPERAGFDQVPGNVRFLHLNFLKPKN